VDEDGDIVMEDISDPVVTEQIAVYLADERKHQEPIANNDVSSSIPIAPALVLSLVQIKYPSTKRHSPSPTSSTPPIPCILVIDTCFILSHMNFVEQLVRANRRWGNVVMMPWAVIMELDGLKVSRKINPLPGGGVVEVCHLARRANSWAFERLRNADPGFWGQTREEVIDRTATRGDDAILDCCR
jgi:hypothetical protein